MRWSYDAGAAPGLWRTARQVLAEHGVLYVARVGVLWATFPLWGLYFRLFPRGFEFQSARHRYLLRAYNQTWSNERSVEVPIVWAEVGARRGGRVLEVGNVLSHYFPVDHEVIDKFERARAVRNEDVASFRSPHRYDLIVSISTLEHVGWDEEPRDPEKIPRALANLRGHLAPGGRLVVTLAVGYNPALDRLLAAGALPFSRCHYMRRHGLISWSEADWPAIAGSVYGRRWPGAEGLVIGVVEA